MVPVSTQSVVIVVEVWSQARHAPCAKRNTFKCQLFLFMPDIIQAIPLLVRRVKGVRVGVNIPGRNATCWPLMSLLSNSSHCVCRISRLLIPIRIVWYVFGALLRVFVCTKECCVCPLSNPQLPALIPSKNMAGRIEKQSQTAGGLALGTSFFANLNNLVATCGVTSFSEK